MSSVGASRPQVAARQCIDPPVARQDLSDLLAAAARPEEIDPAQYDAIYFTGGHAVMSHFPDNEDLQQRG